MTETRFRDRSAVSIENEVLRVTVLKEGGHIAEVFDKRAGVSPLWIPRWDSREPSTFSQSISEEYGSGVDAKLLAGIMGHNLCLDIFGGPSREEAKAGLGVHGEASVDTYIIEADASGLRMGLTLRLAQLRLSRTIQLRSNRLKVHETVENLAGVDRPLAWTQHVTLGPPFLDPRETEFRASLAHSVVSDSDPGSDAYLSLGKEFTWPIAPRVNGGSADLRQMNAHSPASSYTAHLVDPNSGRAHFVAYSPQYRLAFGYLWRREDFPWMGIWEENCSRLGAPWLGREVTRGMEFGVSPFPESRREMVERNKLFGVPAYRWIAAGERLEAEYWIVSEIVDSIPDTLEWPGDSED